MINLTKYPLPQGNQTRGSIAFVARLTIICSLALPPTARAQTTPASATDRNTAAHNAFDAAEQAAQRADKMTATDKYAEAARGWLAAVEQYPDNETNRGRRNALFSKALNSFRLSVVQDPSRCYLIHEALFHADVYRRGLESHYSEAATLDEHKAVIGLETELREALAVCEKTTPQEEATLQKPAPTPEPVTEPLEDIGPTPQERRHHENRLRVTFGVTTSLAALLLVASLGTGLSRIRKPFMGAAYRDVRDAAAQSFFDATPDNEVPFAGVDMCGSQARSRNSEVQAACKQWDRLGVSSIITGIAAGIFVAAAVGAAAILYDRRHGRRQQAAQRAAAGVSILPRGFGLNATFQF